MKQAFKIVIGLALIAAGVLWILNITGVFTFEFSTKGWWALFIIVPCIIGLFSDKAVSTFPPSICHEVMGLDPMILVFLNVEF